MTDLVRAAKRSRRITTIAWITSGRSTISVWTGLWPRQRREGAEARKVTDMVERVKTRDAPDSVDKLFRALREYLNSF